VEALIDDPEAWVRQGVAAFLGELGDRESLAVLRRRIDREREAQTAPALKAAAAALEKRLGQ